ncbi:MAG: HAD-IA family hydrolase [bacterium]
MSQDNMPSWVVFDYYGVIVVDVMKETLLRHEKPEIDAAVHDLSQRFDLGEIDSDSYVKQLSKLYGISEERASWIKDPKDSFDPDLVRYMEHLRNTGIKIGIASNSNEESLHGSLQAAGLSGVVDAIVASSSIHAVKPDPRFWKELLRVTRAQPNEILLVDDRIENCHGAELVGMQTLLYTGYDAFCEQIKAIIQPNSESKTDA